MRGSSRTRRGALLLRAGGLHLRALRGLGGMSLLLLLRARLHFLRAGGTGVFTARHVGGVGLLLLLHAAGLLLATLAHRSGARLLLLFGMGAHFLGARGAGLLAACGVGGAGALLLLHAGRLLRAVLIHLRRARLLLLGADGIGLLAVRHVGGAGLLLLRVPLVHFGFARLLLLEARGLLAHLSGVRRLLAHRWLRVLRKRVLLPGLLLLDACGVGELRLPRLLLLTHGEGLLALGGDLRVMRHYPAGDRRAAGHRGGGRSEAVRIACP